jgi:hypothetical protein
MVYISSDTIGEDSVICPSWPTVTLIDSEQSLVMERKARKAVLGLAGKEVYWRITAANSGSTLQ